MKIFAVKTRGHSPRTFTHAPCRTHVSHIKVYLRLQSPHNARAEQNQYRMQYRRFTTPDTTPELPYRLLNFAPDLPKTAPSETAPRVLEGPTSGPSQLNAPRFSAPLAHSSLPLLCAWQVLASLGWCALPGQLAPHT